MCLITLAIVVIVSKESNTDTTITVLVDVVVIKFDGHKLFCSIQDQYCRSRYHAGRSESKTSAHQQNPTGYIMGFVFFSCKCNSSSHCYRRTASSILLVSVLLFFNSMSLSIVVAFLSFVRSIILTTVSSIIAICF